MNTLINDMESFTAISVTLQHKCVIVFAQLPHPCKTVVVSDNYYISLHFLQNQQQQKKKFKDTT